jgi:hypothetical protein
MFGDREPDHDQAPDSRALKPHGAAVLDALRGRHPRMIPVDAFDDAALARRQFAQQPLALSGCLFVGRRRFRLCIHGDRYIAQPVLFRQPRLFLCRG